MSDTCNSMWAGTDCRLTCEDRADWTLNTEVMPTSCVPVNYAWLSLIKHKKV